MNPIERDRSLVSTYEYLRTVKEAVARAEQAVDTGIAIAVANFSPVGRNGFNAMVDAEQAVIKLKDALSNFANAIHFYLEIGNQSTDDERIELARKARACASITVGEISKCADFADSAGAWMMVKSVRDACELASKAQTIAWEGEQAINK